MTSKDLALASFIARLHVASGRLVEALPRRRCQLPPLTSPTAETLAPKLQTPKLETRKSTQES